VRTRHRCAGHQIFRGDANDLTVMLEFPSREAGDAFSADLELRQHVDEAGVVSEPRRIVG